MIRMAAHEVRAALSDVLNRVAYSGERVVIQRHGKDVAMMVPVEAAGTAGGGAAEPVKKDKKTARREKRRGKPKK